MSSTAIKSSVRLFGNGNRNSFFCVAGKCLSTSQSCSGKKKYPLVIVGGGAGGCSTAANFVGKLGKGNVAVIEPRKEHAYQPLWTLVGGGQKNFEDSKRPMESVLPSDADWIRDKVSSFDPDANVVTLGSGEQVEYDWLVVAMGIQLNYNKIKGLPEGFSHPGIGSNYHPEYVRKTWQAVQDFKEGNAVFSFPNTPVKCAGAPQKIMYLTERILSKSGRRDKAQVIYHTSLPVLFGVKKYADALWEVVKQRNIQVNCRSNLVEVDAANKVAYFQNLEQPDDKPTAVEYSMLHVTPPQGPPDVLAASTKLVDQAGFLDVDKETLQHKKYANIFGIGDCTNVPCAKTAAAVAGQLGHLRKNLNSAMEGTAAQSRYDGYTSCPLVTGPGECILAEFNFQAPPEPLETFPFNQAKPRWSMYQLKANIIPGVYWQMLKGRWVGPSVVRKTLHLGMKS